jgi:hypothetical protein
MHHDVEIGGRRRGQLAFLQLPELRGRVKLRVKTLHRLRSVMTTAAPSGVVLLLVCVVVESRSRPTQVASEGFRSIENKKFPMKTNKNSQDLIYEMQNNKRGNQIYIPL